MRLLIIAILSIFLTQANMAVVKCTTTAISAENSMDIIPFYTEAVADTALQNLEDKVQFALVKSLQTRDIDHLNDIVAFLEDQDENGSNPVILYWKSYAKYYTGIAQLSLKQKEESKTTIEEGMEILRNLEKKTSDHYALLSLLQGFYIQFKSGMEAGMISQKAKLNAEKAIDLEPENIRGYYVMASNDFYTPAQYGGGRKTEELLLKAIELEDQVMPNPYLPKWGKSLSYIMLVKHYMKTENTEKAKEYLQKGLEIYPKNYTLNKLKGKV